MISFIDEKGKRHSALATIKRKKAVNGEKSLEGVIHTNDDVISKMDIGWKVIFEYERYVITYAQPIDNGNTVELQLDAVHEFFYDFLKSSVYEALNGSHTMEYYLNFIFKDSGYTYLLDNPVPAFEKENFGMENRLSLFNNIINQVGAEFVVNNTVVRITDKVGQDLSTVVRKGLNMQDITIEKNIKNFITYRKGYGKFLDEEDESLGRVEAEYESALSAIYGRLEGDPFVDERFSTQSSLLGKIKESVENSYNISVQLTMEDLTKAGYKYEQPQEGDYIMVINEDIGFKKKVRIVSYESEFDTRGELIDHQVVCNSVGLVKATGDSRFDDIWHEIDKIEKNINVTYIAANGKNMIYRGPNEPNHDQLIINDTWYKDVGNGEHEVYIWTGAYWEKIIIEDARFNNLDANSMTTGSLRGGKVSWDLDTGRLLMGNSVSDYSLYFDGNNLNLGGNTSISWDNITSQPSIPTSPGDIGAKPDGWLPTWSEIKSKPTILSADDIKSTVITKDWIATLGLLVGSEIQMGSNAKISWSNVTGTTDVANKSDIPTTPEEVGALPSWWKPTWNDVSNKPTIPNDQYITNITKDTITTSYINALGVRAKSLLAGTINIGNNAFQVDVDGWLHAGKGGFSVPPDADGVFNVFTSSETGTEAARWKYDNANYMFQTKDSFRVYTRGTIAMELLRLDSHGHTGLRLMSWRENGALIKALGIDKDNEQVQFRNVYDKYFIEIAASNFKVASSAKIKKDITYCKSKLDLVKNTPVFNFRLKDDKSEEMNTGFIVESSPSEITTKLGKEDGISIVDTLATLWKAVQELNAKVEKLEKGEMMELDVNLVIEKLMKQMNDLILKNTMLEIQLEQLQKVEGGDESEE